MNSDLGSSNYYRDFSAEDAVAGIEWLCEVSGKDKWNLSSKEVACLLGDISVQKFNALRRRIKNGDAVRLSEDIIERLSLLVGIFNYLVSIVPEGRLELAYSWFNRPNDNLIFGGLSIRQYLLDRSSIEGFYLVLRYLENGAR